MTRQEIRIGVISDTHGLLRPEAQDALKGVDRIVHAGDIGPPEILAALRTIAPVTAVRGNMDRAGWALELPETEVLEAGGLMFYVLHNLARLDLDPAAAGFYGVIYGHSHRPSEERYKDVLYLNPGSAGPRRLGWNATLALLTIEEGGCGVQTVLLE